MRDLFELVEVPLSSNRNGCQSNKKAYLPSSWEEAESLAKENGLKIVDLSKKDGQNSWYNNGEMINPFTIDDIPTNDNQWKVSIVNINEVRADYLTYIQNIDAIETCRKILENYDETMSFLEDLEQNDCIILYNTGEYGYAYYDILYDIPMGYSYDTTKHRIGLIE